MARKLNIPVVKVGYAFELFKKSHSSIPVYESATNDHPSEQGSYLIACLFYRFISGKSLKNVKYAPTKIPGSEAKIIRAFADSIS